MEDKKTQGPPVFTRDELKKFDGEDGRPLYIVFRGKVYNLSASRLWVNGKHMAVHQFDEDLEATIKQAPHSEEVLNRFSTIGELRTEQVLETHVQEQWQ